MYHFTHLQKNNDFLLEYGKVTFTASLSGQQAESYQMPVLHDNGR